MVDGQTAYKRPSIRGAGAPGTAAPPGKAIQSSRHASIGSQSLTNLVEQIGEDFLMFSSDYPHADRTEGTAKYLKERDDISATVRVKLLEDNARGFYGF